MSQPFLEQERTLTPVHAGRWMVVIFNNDTNSFEEVIGVLMSATGCSYEEASIETWEAHAYGQAPVHFDAKVVCEEIALQIFTVGVKTEVRKEWED